MEIQEVFDKVWNHFVVQKNPSSVSPDRNKCLYRGPDGAKCAVGIFIPDDIYTTDMENGTCYTLFQRYPQVAEIIGKENSFTMRELQKIHDVSATSPFFHAEIAMELRKFAQTWGLEVPKDKE